MQRHFLTFVCLLTTILAVYGQCPNEDALIDQFTAATKQYKIYTEHGESCMIEHDHEDDHDDDHDDHDDDHDDHDDHDHDHKRRKRAEDEDSDHDHEEEFIANVSCQTLYNVCRTTILNLSLTTEDCLEGHTHGGNSSSSVSSAQAYGYGFLMILFVSLCSLGGIFLVPLIVSESKTGRYIYELVYAFMVAIAISALVSDAVLHLLPHSFGLHDHDEEEDGHDHDHEESIDFIWKGCLVLLGLYAFYLLEFFLHSFGHDHYVKENSDAPCEGQSHGRCPTDDVHFTSSIPLGNKKKETESSLNEGNLSSKDSRLSNSTDGAPIVSDNDVEAQTSIWSKLCVHPKKIKSVAWLIIIGDAVHNLADGLALGAAISQSLSLGVSTMFALIFHEIPHEFGDFVILIKSGFHWATALFVNFMQSLSAILGFFIGVAVSTNTESASNWILAITAGLFLYIALTDLLPELVHGGGHGILTQSKKNHDAAGSKGNLDWILRFTVINIGFFVAFAILLVIAIYEEDLNNLIK